jgi:hypothetical protein
MAAKGNGAPDGQCETYARKLQADVEIPTVRVSWIARCNEPLPAVVKHTVVSYRVGKEVWFISNDWPTPRWVGNEGDSWEAMIKQWYAPSWVTVSNIAIDESQN